jgi:hypothetical protein
MSARPLLPIVAVLVLAACGTATDRDLVTGSVPDADDAGHSSLTRSDVPFDALESSGECLASVVSWAGSLTLALRGTIDNVMVVDDSRYDATAKMPSVGALLRLKDVVSLDPEVASPTTGTLWVSQAVFSSPNWLPASTDLSSLTVGAEVIVRYLPSPQAESDILGYYSGSVSRSDIGISFSTCSDAMLKMTTDRAEYFGASDGFALIEEWIAVEAKSGLAGLEALEAEFAEATREPSAWDALEPRLRSIRPIDVPADVAGRLDVRGVVLELEGLGAEQSVVVRSDSGVSYIVSPTALPATVPVFFLPDVDKTVSVWLSDGPSEQELFSVPVDELTANGGVVLSGKVDSEDRTGRVVSIEEFAEMSGLTVDQLEALRTSLLVSG